MRYLLQVLFIVFTANHLCAEDISTGDFTAGYYLEVTGEGAIYSLEIPQEVYRTVTRSDLGDIRVFNNAGEVVPHGLKNVKSDPDSGRTREPVPFFPMYGEVGGDIPVGVSVQVGVAGVGKSHDGTIVSINPPPGKGSADRQLKGYLLDMSQLARSPKNLEFQWSSDSQSSVVKVELQQSDNLVSWSRLVRKATLVNLNYGGHKVERKTVRLPYPTKKYLKLTWQENSGEILLTSVVSSSEIIPSRVKRQWISLNTKTAMKESGTLLLDFNSPYHLPVNSAQLNFSKMNSLARVSLSSRTDEDSEWQVRCQQLFYSLYLQDQHVQNEPCVFSPRSDTNWRLAIEEDGAGLGESGTGLGLQLGWTPSELYFVGRGSPPYLLAFGSGKLQSADNSAESKLVLLAMETAAIDQSTFKAGIGKRTELGGEQALEPPPRRPPWKKWLLWTVLVSGVGVLAVMARSLVKEMRVSKGSSDS